MKTRRDFVKLAAGAGLLSAGAAGATSPLPSAPSERSTPKDTRAQWCVLAERLALPVLTTSLSALSATGDCRNSIKAVACVLAGLAPWFEQADLIERKKTAPLARLAQKRIDEVVQHCSHDGISKTLKPDLLVGIALVAQALIRAPNALWNGLQGTTQEAVLRLLTATRRVRARESYAVVVEIAVQRFGGKRDHSRLYNGLRHHQNWGERDDAVTAGFHWDVPYALVVQPMLLEALDLVAAMEPTWCTMRDRILDRFRTFAEIEERLVAPDGSYPSFCSSRHYRCGIFQGLALAAWRHVLPPDLPPGQARAALTAVIRRTLDVPPAFECHALQQAPSGCTTDSGCVMDSAGLRYLSSTVFLPLALPVSDLFWTDQSRLLTWERTWAQDNVIE